MKLTEIQIDCHGVRRNLTLTLRSRGLSVIYGPNEAGKTTLREFIGGVLFGFSRDEQSPGRGLAGRLPAAGSLVIEDASGSHRLHRAAVGDPAGDAQIVGDAAACPAASVLEGRLRGIDAELFERIFAVGLRELMDLSSLSGDDVAQHLFGLSLGPTGGRILAASRRVEERRSKLIDPLQQHGELVEAFERHDQLTARLNELGQLQERHTEWSLRRDQLEREIADLRKRQTGTAEQLRGHEFLERVWGPWDRTRDCRHELDDLPKIADFPERGLERLERLENEIAAAAESRDRILAEVRQIRSERLPSADDAAWRAQAPALRGFVEQRDWLENLDDRRRAAEHEVAERERELTAACEQLGAGWTGAHIEHVDVSAAAQRKLSGTADSFLSAVARRKRIQRKCRRIAATCRDLKESLAESLHDLDGRPIDVALAEARDHVAGLNQQATLRLKEVELAQRLAGLEQHRQRIAPQLTLPRWVYIVLGVFAFMGVILAGWGLVAGVATSGIAGAIYAMLGITCGGLAWGLKIQYEGEARERLSEIEQASAAAATELAGVGDAIRQANSGVPSADEPATLICQAQDRIGELVELAAHQRRLRGMRRNLVAARKKLEIARREVGTARAHWTDLVAKLGLPETLSVDEALAAWQLLVEAAGRLDACRLARAELQSASGLWDDCRQRMLDVARRLPAGHDALPEPLEQLAAWREQLDFLDRQRNERRDLRDRLRIKQREAREFNKRVESLKLQRNALLVQGGAANRDEFEDRARSFARRTYLEDQMHDARSDLDAACADHGDLALVEEDLEQFDARQNSECIETLRLELADLERDLERAFEHLGGVKREIESLENDTQSTKVRFELREIEDRLQTLAGEWAVCESAAASIDDIRRDFERTHQPQALAEAAKIFARITRGKYRNLWTPLGQRRLIVEDDLGRSFPVQSLSRGTREQLLLAVRLAVVRKLAAEGTSLPVILDDVIVNFDEDRAAAAVDLLLELAEQGQQVLFFTCHKHLAQLFAAHGIDPLWLPTPTAAAAAIDEHEEKRLAG